MMLNPWQLLPLLFLYWGMEGKEFLFFTPSFFHHSFRPFFFIFALMQGAHIWSFGVILIWLGFIRMPVLSYSILVNDFV